MNRDFLFKGEGPLISEVIKFFLASVLGDEHFKSVVAVCLQNPQLANSNRRLFVQKGQFSWTDFWYYHGIVIQPKGGLVKNLVIEEVVRRLCECHLLAKSDYVASLGLDYFHVNEPSAKFLLERDALENLLFDSSHLVEKYSSAILKVLITDNSGDQWMGTGFLMASKNLLITNKHVVEEDANGSPQIVTLSGNAVPLRHIEISPSTDLAIVELAEAVDARPLFLYEEVDSLDDVITMGYPRIPLALACPLVSHKGEINGTVQIQEGIRLLFSAKTAPGNSGGP